MTKSRKIIQHKRKVNDFEWLKSNIDFELVYKNGQTIVSKDKKLKAKYFFLDNEKNCKVKAGISVGSDKGNSVWRNRLKRIFREAIRKEKEDLSAIARQKNACLLIILSPHSINEVSLNKIYFKDIATSFFEILIRLKEPALFGQK